MKCTLKFFDESFRMKVGKDKGTPIWEIDSSYLRWMLDRGREGMSPLEVDILRAFINERKRLQKLYLEKEDNVRIHVQQKMEKYDPEKHDDRPKLSEAEQEVMDALFA